MIAAALDIACLLCGLGLFLRGFGQLKKRRLIENSPTARARSAAMGFGELSGTASSLSVVKSPVTGVECVFYKYRIEEWQPLLASLADAAEGGSCGIRRNLHWHWRTKEEGSSEAPFFLKDGAGVMMVDPAGAEVVMAPSYRYTDTNLVTFRRTRYSEWKIMPGARVYVLGTVGTTKDIVQLRKERLTERLRELKRNPGQRAAFDSNGDGVLCAEEWEAARAQTERELTQEEAAETETIADTVIAKGGNGAPFILSDKSEKELRKVFKGRASLHLTAGAGVVTLMLASLLARSGLLPDLFRIPWEAVSGVYTMPKAVVDFIIEELSPGVKPLEK